MQIIFHYQHYIQFQTLVKSVQFQVYNMEEELRTLIYRCSHAPKAIIFIPCFNLSRDQISAKERKCHFFTISVGLDSIRLSIVYVLVYHNSSCPYSLLLFRVKVPSFTM